MEIKARWRKMGEEGRKGRKKGREYQTFPCRDMVNSVVSSYNLKEL